MRVSLSHTTTELISTSDSDPKKLSKHIFSPRVHLPIRRCLVYFRGSERRNSEMRQKLLLNGTNTRKINGKRVTLEHKVPWVGALLVCLVASGIRNLMTSSSCLSTLKITRLRERKPIWKRARWSKKNPRKPTWNFAFFGFCSSSDSLYDLPEGSCRLDFLVKKSFMDGDVISAQCCATFGQKTERRAVIDMPGRLDSRLAPAHSSLVQQTTKLWWVQ